MFQRCSSRHITGVDVSRATKTTNATNTRAVSQVSGSPVGGQPRVSTRESCSPVALKPSKGKAIVFEMPGECMSRVAWGAKHLEQQVQGARFQTARRLGKTKSVKLRWCQPQF
jgi:hypothetical protein